MALLIEKKNACILQQINVRIFGQSGKRQKLVVLQTWHFFAARM